MRTVKKFAPFILIFAAIVSFYSFFHIDGKEIKFVDKLLEAKSVDVTVYDEKKEEKFELELTPKQVRQLKTLIEENTYIRRLSSTIIGVLPDKRYIILANWDDGERRTSISA